MKRCSTCGVEILDHPFAYMNGAGESTISKISIFDNDLLLCPVCTKELYNFLIKLVNENKEIKRDNIKKAKVISFNEFKNNL